MRPEDDEHQTEYERDGKRRRVSCSCGFLGPWRASLRTAEDDAIAHEERRAEGRA